MTNAVHFGGTQARFTFCQWSPQSEFLTKVTVHQELSPCTLQFQKFLSTSNATLLLGSAFLRSNFFSIMQLLCSN